MFAENHFFVRVAVVGFRKGEFIGTATGGARIARLKILRVQTNERFGEFERELPLADRFLAGEKQRVRNSIACQHSPQNYFYLSVAEKFAEHKNF